MIIDTHAHLYYDNLFNNIEEVLQRAIDSGVGKIVAPAVNLESAEKILLLSEKYNNIYAAIGFHPCDLKGLNIADLKFLENLLKHPKVVAVGEIGLDYYWDKTNIDLQKSFFVGQLEIAADIGLPVIIHTRDSIKDAISILKNFNNEKLSGQFHCFSGDENDLKDVLGFDNFFISFCGNVTYKKFSAIKIVADTPVEKLLAETDSPFLTPEPFRGKQNEPSKVIYTIKKISEIKGIDFNFFASQLYENTMLLFKKIK